MGVVHDVQLGLLILAGLSPGSRHKRWLPSGGLLKNDKLNVWRSLGSLGAVGL